MQRGAFIISLDFELMWGVWDSKSIEGYGVNILEVHNIIPRLINLFEKYSVGATFATVGFLHLHDKKDLIDNFPEHLPRYNNDKYNPYLSYIRSLREEDQAYYFAPQLIEQIRKSGFQEIGTHTYAHIYCLEDGMSEEAFESDLCKSIEIANKRQIGIYSLVFPRNQFNEKYINICSKHGLTSYRGNESSWVYAAKNGEGESLIRRAVRLTDSYINLTGHHCYNFTKDTPKVSIINIPSSRFLRPYNKRFSFLENLKMKRIKNSMTHAAKNNLMYHLWWHPHNFGSNTDENFRQLEEILQHYQMLNQKHSFQNHTMASFAKFYTDGN